MKRLIKGFLRMIGWVPLDEVTGKEIDPNHVWEFKSISRKNDFQAWIIERVPDGSVWSIEGFHDPDIFETVQDFVTEDGVRVHKGTVWPRQRHIKIKLNAQSKKAILDRLEDWNLDVDIRHQHIYKGEMFYLTAYDNLHAGCTWLTKMIDRAELDELEDRGILEYEKED